MSTKQTTEETEETEDTEDTDDTEDTKRRTRTLIGIDQAANMEARSLKMKKEIIKMTPLILTMMLILTRADSPYTNRGHTRGCTRAPLASGRWL